MQPERRTSSTGIGASDRRRAASEVSKIDSSPGNGARHDGPYRTRRPCGARPQPYHVPVRRAERHPWSRRPAAIAPVRMRRVLRHVDENLHRRIGLKELAALVGLRPWYFCRAFKRETGLPPNRYILALRLGHACRLLSSPDGRLADIAATVGLSSQAHFRSAFKRMLGVPPGRWRALPSAGATGIAGRWLRRSARACGMCVPWHVPDSGRRGAWLGRQDVAPSARLAPAPRDAIRKKPPRQRPEQTEDLNAWIAATACSPLCSSCFNAGAPMPTV